MNGYKDNKTPVFHLPYLWKHQKENFSAGQEQTDQLSGQQKNVR